MPIPSTGYAIPTITALKTIAPTDRTNGYTRLVLSSNAWYTFNSASTAAGDDLDVVVPADNPTSGRWLKTRASLEGAIASSEKGVANGVPTLDTNALIPVVQIPLILPVSTTIDYEGTISGGILTENNLIWLLLDGATIGNATSGATRYADAKARSLFEKLWSNPNLAIFTAAGGASTKGASATADFDASKRLALPDPRGRTILAAGTGSGLSLRTWGETGGAERHTLQINEIPSHNHPRTNTTQQDLWGYNPANPTAKVTLSDAGNLPFSGTQLNDTGGGNAHNNMQPYYVSSGKLILAGRS